ncbi:MAG: SDR family NAD(P)-dependent oxidoreductase [Rhodoferax sp.]
MIHISWNRWDHGSLFHILNLSNTMQSHQHTDRVAFVTGAASGIGREIARQLALVDGARVYIADRDAVGAEEAVAEIQSEGGRAKAVTVDLGNITALQSNMAELTSEFGPPDILVNNAGIVATIPALDYPLDHWNLSMAVNVTAPMLLAQHALRHMTAKRWGRVINIASISGVRAGSGRLAYGTSKAAVIAMTKQFAIEVAQAGVTVNAIAPGPIETPLVARLLPAADRDFYGSLNPMRRFGDPKDIASAVLFLASTQAGFITGETLAVDGGFLAAGVLVHDMFDKSSTTAAL